MADKGLMDKQNIIYGVIAVLSTLGGVYGTKLKDANSMSKLIEAQKDIQFIDHRISVINKELIKVEKEAYDNKDDIQKIRLKLSDLNIKLRDHRVK